MSFGRGYGLIKDDDLSGQCIVCKTIIIPSSSYQQFGRQEIVVESPAKCFVPGYCTQVQSLWQGGYQAAAQPFWHCQCKPHPVRDLFMAWKDCSLMITPGKACPGCCTMAEQGKPWSCWPRARASGWEILADPLTATDMTSLCIPLVPSEAVYGLTFQQPQKAGDCSKKGL